MIKKILSIGISLSVVLLMSGCSQRLGNMTVVSTNNIDGLKTEVSSKDRVEGESCNHLFIIIPFGDFQNRLQIATDNAIDNGRTAGLKGDVLVNAKIDITSWVIPFIYGQNCLKVEGDLVPLASSIK